MISFIPSAPGQPALVSGQWGREAHMSENEGKHEGKGRLEDTHPEEMSCLAFRRQN